MYAWISNNNTSSSSLLLQLGGDESESINEPNIIPIYHLLCSNQDKKSKAIPGLFYWNSKCVIYITMFWRLAFGSNYFTEWT